MEYKINFKNNREINEFLDILEKIPYSVYLKRKDGFRVNAKSIIAILMASNWEEILCYCEKDISEKIKFFIKKS